MRMLQGLLAAAAIAVAGAGAAKADTMGIGTLPQGSLGYAIASGVAKVVSENTGLDVRAVGQGGSSVYLPQVNNGELEFGTSNTFESIFARTGTGNFEGRKNENLRLVTTLVPFDVGFMVRRESDIGKIEDLAGKPFPADYSSMKLVAIMQDAAFAAVGMSMDDVDPVPVPNFVKGAQLLAEGRVAGVLLAPGSGVVAETDAKAPVRFLSIPDTEEAQAAIEQVLPSATLATVEPSERMPYITEPVTLIHYKYTLVTHKDVPEEAVYQVVKALYENKDGLVASHGIFNGFDPDDMAIRDKRIEYHPGAEKFFKEQGIWPAEG